MPDLPSMLSSGQRSVSAGIETYIFEVSTTGVEALNQAAVRGLGRLYVNSILCGWYTLHPRPAAEDIIGATLKFNPGTGRMIVELKIRRGAEAMTEFMLNHWKHGQVRVESDGGDVTMTCKTCHAATVLHKDTFTSYLSNFGG